MSTMVDEYTNEELREMGIPEPCECLEMRVEYDDWDRAYNVCEDCNSAHVRPIRSVETW